ncbi:MAG: NAD(P)/FAD-dependent oxidoreductase [Ruminiclostridium sp.]|nr:NAD(P)/FAD-dependent oxidoreductase [Ruminiclostridium sp.]
MPKKVIILGAGYGGIEAALTLYKKKKKNDDIEITVIDRNPFHTLLTELHEVAGNRIDDEGVLVPLRDIFKYTDIKLVQEEIVNADFSRKELVSKSNKYSFDYLVFAVGSEPNLYGIPGMDRFAFTLWSYYDAIRIREHIKDCFVKASQERDADVRKSLLTFTVGGGGFTGVEMIGELALWVKSLSTEYSILLTETRLMLIEALPGILNNLREKSSKKAMKYLTEKLKVEVLTNSAISKVGSSGFELRNGAVIPSDTLIWTAGIKPSYITETIECGKAKSRRILVDKHCETQYKDIYAVGDVSSFVTEAGPLPALVEAAIQTGENAAHNILADIRGKEKTELHPKLHGVMVSIGSYFAVADVMNRQWSRLISIVLKYLVTIHYLFGIGGFELIFRYIRHEFLHKKQVKTLPEKHISVLTLNFWLVPIRLFLGYSWLKEGIAKISEGWLNTTVLAGLPADASTGASTTEAGEKVFRIISDFTPGWYAWIANNIVLPNALIFQIIIVLTETALGLAFITGTFTFIASLASIGLIINFLLSTGFYDYNWWFIPAALCLLGGGGRAFGIDYYLIPYLMRLWRYFERNKRMKLFLFR